MPLTKSQVFDALDTNVGNSLDLRGNTLNQLLKDLYESIEALIIAEANTRSLADIALTEDIAAEAGFRDAADVLLSEAIGNLELIVDDNVSRLIAAEALIQAFKANFIFAGIATPATDPGLSLVKRVYIASENGTYSNFPSDELPPYTVSNELVLFFVYESGFSAKQTILNL